MQKSGGTALYRSRIVSVRNFLSFLSFAILSCFLALNLVPFLTRTGDSSAESIENTPYELSIAASDNINLRMSATDTLSITSHELAISTTCPAGYTLNAETIEGNRLYLDGDNTSDYFISPTDGTMEAPLELATNQWGASLDEPTSNDHRFFALTTEPAELSKTNISSEDTFVVYYGVRADSTLKSGDYSADITYTALPNPDCYTYNVTWDFDGGTENPDVTYPTILNYGTTVDLSQLTPTMPGYTFVGWTNGVTDYLGTETAAILNSTAIESVTLKAKWTPTIYTLTYDNQNGSGCSSQEGPYGGAWGTLCEPTREKYKFNGWFTEKNGAGTQIFDTTVISGDQKVYASWTEIIPVLTLINNGDVSSVTGGWVFGQAWSYLSNCSLSTSLSGGIYIADTGSCYSGSIVGSQKTVDLSKYKTAKVTLSYTYTRTSCWLNVGKVDQRITSSTYFGLGNYGNVTNPSGMQGFSFGFPSRAFSGTYTADISNITTNSYLHVWFGCGSYSDDTGSVKVTFLQLIP